MTTGPLVSICIPTYNRAAYLRESLQGVCAQTYRPLEILISDNASDDETEELCRRLASSDNRVRYVRQPSNIGLYGNHNFCMNESRGTFLCLFHDDDHHDPEAISRSVAFLLEHPEAGLVCPDWRLMDDEGRRVGTRRHLVKSVTPGLEYIEKTLQTGRSFICTPGTVIRKSALGDIRFNEKGPLGFADFVIWFRIAEHYSVGHIAEPLWSYRQHKGSLSRRTVHSMTADYDEVLMGYCKEHLTRWPNRTDQVKRWEGMIHKFLFWALVYEICLNFRTESPQRSAPLSEKTFFERMSYRLDTKQLQEVKRSLLRHQRGILQPMVRSAIEWMLRIHLTWPLAQMTRYPEPFRAILGMK